MLFNLEADTGAAIVGYVVPDGYSAVPAIVLRSKNKEVLVQPANEVRPALVVAGRHETGTCGFRIDETAAPGLSRMEDLELYEAQTNVLIYRRPQAHHLARKILRLETHLLPLWRLDNALKSQFQYSSLGIESLGRETTTQMFLLNHVNSVYVSGRLLYKNYVNHIESRFETIFMMHNPYEEMAERLLVLQKIKTSGSNVLGMRDNLSMQSAMDFAHSLRFDDEAALTKALRKMPLTVANTLADPIVRQLTTTTPDEMPTGRSVSAALDLLASFAVVGLRRTAKTFLDAVGEFAGMDPATLPELSKYQSVATLARALKNSHEVDVLLEKDLELYQHVTSAFKKLA
jgi:hypothetical protein